MKIYYTAKDLSEMLGVSLAKSYEIIKKLNIELEQKGYITIRGKISKAYFSERWYGLEDKKILQNA